MKEKKYRQNQRKKNTFFAVVFKVQKVKTVKKN